MQLMDMQLMENMQLSGYVSHLVAGNSVAAEVKVCWITWFLTFLPFIYYKRWGNRKGWWWGRNRGAMLFRLLSVVWGYRHFGGLYWKIRLFHCCEAMWEHLELGMCRRELEQVCESGPPGASHCAAFWAAPSKGTPEAGRMLTQIYYGQKVKLRSNLTLVKLGVHLKLLGTWSW